MKLQFEKIRWKNFLNAGAQWTEIDFTKTKTTLITGKNGNGKSTLLDALTYALYGKPFRKINKPQLVNTINGKDMVVELMFKSHGKLYLIRRGMKPNIFEIFENSKLIPQTAANGDYQFIIDNQIFKMSFKAFTQICVLGKANFTAFMDLAAADRRKIVEDLLDLNLFSMMNTLLKEDVKILNEQIRETRTQVDLNNAILLEKKRSLSRIQENVDDILSKLEVEYQQALAEMEELKTHRAELLKDPSKKQSLEIQRDKFKAQKASFIALGASVKQANDKLKKEHIFFTENEACPTCSQSITSEFKAVKISGLDETIEKNEQGVVIAETKKVELDKVLDEVEDALQIEQEKEHNILFNARQIAGKVSQIAKLEESIAGSKSRQEIDDTELLAEIEKLQFKLDNFANEAVDQSKERETLDMAAILLKDGGIKTKIISQYIPKMNEIIQKYLSIMDFYIRFELNETFDETIKTRNMETFTFNSFSEGQKARIELALLFTWRELSVLRNNASTNLLILDETFDGSMDSDGGDNLFDIIREISKDTNVFVITHKSDAYTDKFDRELKVGIKKNFSTMVEA